MTSELVLASASPRRRELLTAMGIAHRVVPSAVDETSIAADHPRTYAIRCAYAKALDVAARMPADTLVLAADTVVTRRAVLFGKPATEDEAFRILRSLSGESHEVITGVALARAGRAEVQLDSATTTVAFRPLTDGDIRSYIATGEPMDKAGAYGIQGIGGDFIERIDGDYYNVVGLPCTVVARLLESHAGFASLTVPKPPERWAARRR